MLFASPMLGRCALALVLVLASIGCSFIEDFGRFEIVEPDASTDASQDAALDAGGDAAVDAGADADTQPDLTCVDHVLEVGATTLVTSTSGGADRFASSCGGTGAPDAVVEWIAPSTDFYRFHTSGGDFEPVLSLLDGHCAAEELACSDAQSGPYTTEIVRHVTQGTRVLAVVDGRGGDSGSATLNVEVVTCPAIQLTSALLPVEHSTASRPSYPAMGCVEDAFGARTYRFTAPEDGHYSFVALGQAGFRPSIMLEESPACGGVVLQCNRAHDDLRAEVLRSLRAGEHVTIVISGSEGEGVFLLDVTRTDHASHIDDALDTTMSSGTRTFSLVSNSTPSPVDWSVHRMTTSCGPGSATDVVSPYTVRPRADLNLRVDTLNPSTSCSRLCSVTITAGFPFHASTSELDEEDLRARREISCHASQELTTVEPGEPNHQRQLFIDALSKHPKLITIDRATRPNGGAPSLDETFDDVHVQWACMDGSPCFP